LTLKIYRLKIAHIKDNGKTKTCRVDAGRTVQLLCEKKSKDLINDMRYELKYARKGEQAFCVQKIPQIIPAATYRKVKGVIQQTGYNGVVQLEVNDLAGEHEARMVKQTVADLPQTLLAFTGSSGRSVKIWVRFQRPTAVCPIPGVTWNCFTPTLPTGIPHLSAYAELPHRNERAGH
jgi:hypothetical protein